MTRSPVSRPCRAARLLGLAAFLALSACISPEESSGAMPAMRWDNRPEALHWTEATLTALETDGVQLSSVIPADIATFCPGYAGASQDEREAFWAGLLSALAKHESTWNPNASGGGGRWLGLLQIAPATARSYDCTLPAGKGLHDGAANLGCAVKIAARQVGRDGAIVSDGSGGWRGLARDWAPMRSSAKRADIAAWTRAQSYCQK